MNHIYYPVILGTEIQWRLIPNDYTLGNQDSARHRERSIRVRATLARILPDIHVPFIPELLPDAGASADLAVAIAVWSKLTGTPISGHFVGELNLSGFVRPVRGLYAIVADAVDRAIDITVPLLQADEARTALISSCRQKESYIFTCDSFLDATSSTPEILSRKTYRTSTGTTIAPKFSEIPENLVPLQDRLKAVVARKGSALVIAPLGTGVTMAARRAGKTCLDDAELDEVRKVQSIAGLLKDLDTCNSPFRAPHHSVSDNGLFGTDNHPGEVTLSNLGTLFLDEINEYRKSTLENLINIRKLKRVGNYPADFALIGSMRPCSCGYLGDNRCHCTPDKVARYREQIPVGLFEEIIEKDNVFRAL